MPKYVVRRPNEVIEVSDLSFDQVKELLGKNGHRVPTEVPTPAPRRRAASLNPSNFLPDYTGFLAALSEKGKKFFEILTLNPDGITSEQLAPLLGFRSGNQVGGMAGGGLAKLAKKFGVQLEDLYSSKVVFENGLRSRVFKPGKDISQLQ